VSTPFEDFVTVELPVRAAMLTLARCGYDGDPNGGGAPAMVANAPIGTMYLRQTGNLLYQKTSASPGTWIRVGTSSISGTDTMAQNTNAKLVSDSNATLTSKIVVSWLGDHGATRSWVERATGSFTVKLSSNTTVSGGVEFVWEIIL
jgi:hypothetical protein